LAAKPLRELCHNTMEKIECAVIGAGVIGLAVARALAAQGREVLILEVKAPSAPASARATAK
jgi:glycine/D-amino acid oxidase-like deaminating enzyme